MTPRAVSPIDAAAAGLSFACIAHCLALPIAAAALPILGVVSDQEWIHRAFVLAALPLSGFAIVRGVQDGQRTFVGVASMGLLLLVLGAFVERFEAHETALTVLGALLLAAAHVWRWRRHARP